MHTVIQVVDKDRFDNKELAAASKVLKEGGLVAFPTETVYGLGANALDELASKKIYEAKGRPSDNPLIVHIADTSDLSNMVVELPQKALELAKTFWPGPLTMIFHKSESVPYGTTGGLDTVAVRMPDHPLALALIKYSGIYLAAPSANTSGRPSPTKAEHVIEDLSGKVDMILDGGEVGIGIESTILDMTEDIPVILRPGFITKEMLEAVIGEVQVDQAILKRNQNLNLKPKAPGMKYRHYAPKGELTVFQGAMPFVVKEINKRAKQMTEDGYTVGIVATEETKQEYSYGIVKTIGYRNDAHSIARGLYGVLREFDSLGAQYIYSESFQDNALGNAIMNRLLKAAGYHVVRVD